MTIAAEKPPALRGRVKSRTRLDRDKDIKDREIEVERSVIGKSVVRRDAESFAPPVDKCQRVRCESITPLGTPVEPDVKRM